MNKFIVMSQIKKIVGPAGVNFLKKIRDFVNFYRVYRRDRLKYQKHSSVYNVDTFEKLESEITLLYHGIEKGFLHDNIRPYFARAKVISLLKLIDDRRIDNISWERSHLQSAAANLCNYYEWHSSHGYNLDYFPEQMYIDLCQHLVEKLPSFIQSNKEDYFAQIESPFSEFAKSRSSVREFSDEMVSREILEKVVELANTAPSVCNRQGVSVVVVEDKKIIEKILDIQKGLAGYTSINQLIVLTANRNYFYSVG
ncbi:nitroreductase family protein [Porphyromonas levii]|uniref:nitroreductase family protein n=1 Tax=Porphyromonas levii TaxID=28114 RepID=UPI00036C3568|nr:nitroreductase family protein [Porphyromonas levii]